MKSRLEELINESHKVVVQLPILGEDGVYKKERVERHTDSDWDWVDICFFDVAIRNNWPIESWSYERKKTYGEGGND